MINFEKPKFRIHIDKLLKGDISFGIFFNQKVLENWVADKMINKYYERYIYICLFKYNISIGWLWR